MKILFIAILLAVPCVNADTLYNYIENRWEVVNSPDKQLNYNYVEDEYTYGNPTEYKTNPATGSWGYESKDSELVINPVTGEVEYSK